VQSDSPYQLSPYVDEAHGIHEPTWLSPNGMSGLTYESWAWAQSVVLTNGKEAFDIRSPIYYPYIPNYSGWQPGDPRNMAPRLEIPINLEFTTDFALWVRAQVLDTKNKSIFFLGKVRDSIIYPKWLNRVRHQLMVGYLIIVLGYKPSIALSLMNMHEYFGDFWTADSAIDRSNNKSAAVRAQFFTGDWNGYAQSVFQDAYWETVKTGTDVDLKY